MSVMAYIGFGSNLGDLLGNYHLARAKLAAHPHITITRESQLYQSQALTLTHEPQPAYLNAVIEIKTDLTLYALFRVLTQTETEMGRTRRKRWAARVVDLDILFYDKIVYHDNQLQVPHLGIAHRCFVLKPLCDLIPDFIHPDLNLPLCDLLEGSEDNLQTHLYAESQEVYA